MADRSASRSVAIVVAAMTVTVAGCGDAPGPRRVPDDGAPCSVVMPGAPRPEEATHRLGTIAVAERAWVLRQPDLSVDPPKDFTTYVVRRAAVPAGNALRDTALLDAAAARAARGIALQEGTKSDVAKVSTGAGEAAELRWGTGRSRSATRILLIPGGYCEVTILGARTDADIAAYFSSLQVRAGAND